ncbi:unknown [Candidatus Colimorpha enterica]|jgi:hypothetical protein|uniref:Uncharacterized protein n=1 Tax=Candidatus Colimorpha enterica TaxID=3083063 RepID=R6TPC0_9BACT|nr:unknown [Candidatus Colimorpha enterica]
MSCLCNLFDDCNVWVILLILVILYCYCNGNSCGCNG